MESHVWRDRKIATSTHELNRQYDLIRQTLAMHHSLRDYYRRLTTFTEIILLTASVIFLLTTFADSNFYNLLGLPTDLSKLILGLASAATFLSSLILLLLDWPGKAASHKDSAERWFSVLVLFRNERLEDGTWSRDLEKVSKLNVAYSGVCKNSVDIPDKKFNALKVQYLTKVEISKMASKYPGVPYLILWIFVRSSAIKKVIRRKQVTTRC
jgi:hypothetical protein